MAATVNSDLTIYNDLAQTAYLERIQDVIQVFNGASNGALVLDSESIEGDMRKRALYTVGGAVADRDVNSTSDVTPTKIGSDERVGVKVPWKYGPYATTEEAFKRRARSTAEFSQIVGIDMADALLEYQIGVAVNALTGAIKKGGLNSSPGDFATEGKKALTAGLRDFGDRMERIRLWIMSSATYLDMVDAAIDDKVFEEAGQVVYGGQPGTLGRPVLVTDELADDQVFGLQAGAVQLTESQAPGIRSYMINDKENLELGYRAEGAFNTEVLGYSWAGSANPGKSAFATQSNWAKWANDKATAGILIDVSAAS